jgi:hypothetical protein
MAISWELVTAIGAIICATTSIVLYIEKRFRDTASMIQRNRDHAAAQYHSMALRLLRIELHTGIMDQLPADFHANDKD